jgi:hypothetical protein
MGDARHQKPSKRFSLTRRKNIWHSSTNFGLEKKATHRKAVLHFRKEKVPQNTHCPLLHKFRKQEKQSHGFSAKVFEEEKRRRDHRAAMIGFGRRDGRGQTCHSLDHVFATEEEERLFIPNMFYVG